MDGPKKKDAGGLVYSRFDFSDARNKHSHKQDPKTSIKQLLQKVRHVLYYDYLTRFAGGD